ncbi:hypothetical protein ES705_47969 [subsurface metagenome]
MSLANPDKIKQDCPVVNIPIQQLWERDSLKNKLIAVLKLKYKPNEQLIQKIANEIFKEEFFGKKDDLANPLFDLMIWHQNRDWELKNIQKTDIEKADALEAMTNLSRKRYWDYTSPNLNLRLALRQPIITPLVFPIVAKTPIRSLQYFVDVHSRFAFDSIRKSNHQYVDDIISYLYEALILNQKTANKLHGIVKLIDETRCEKGQAILLKSEIDAISEVDLIVTYLKASIEKITSLTGYTFNISKLEDKKEHKQRIKALESKIPEGVKRQPYYEFFIEHISTSQLEKLNKYRTGILHKKGISSNQPQEFYQKNESYKSFTEMFNYLFEQHCKNSTILIASLALLTDELVKIDKPDFEISKIPFNSLMKELKQINN